MPGECSMHPGIDYHQGRNIEGKLSITLVRLLEERVHPSATGRVSISYNRENVFSRVSVKSIFNLPVHGKQVSTEAYYT